MRVLGIAAAAVCCLSFTGAANASSVIFSDFGPSNSYLEDIGWTVAGAGGASPGNYSAGMAFTSSSAASVSQIDIGIGNVNATPNAATISLWTDVANALGTELASWSITGLPVFGATSNTVVTISGISGVNLAAGASYFLYATAPGGTWNAWNENTIGATGEVLLSCCAEEPEPNTLGAFDVLGSSVTATPLPSTWTMLMAGFAGLGFFAYRGSKKNTAALAAA